MEHVPGPERQEAAVLARECGRLTLDENREHTALLGDGPEPVGGRA
jgi:hypothetical protein